MCIPSLFPPFRSGVMMGTGTDRNQALEQKLFKQQEELHELLRKRGEVKMIEPAVFI